MSRRRSISTELSQDEKIIQLGEEYGELPVLLYTLAIPHADDWGRMKGDPNTFKVTVAPFLMRRSSEIDEAMNQIAAVGLWRRYEIDGRKYIAFPRASWFKYQNYVANEKAEYDGSDFPAPGGETWGSWADRPSAKGKTPQNPKESQKTPQNPSSPSPSPSLTPSETVVQTQDIDQDSPPEEQGGEGQQENAVELPPLPRESPKPAAKTRVTERGSRWEWLRRVRRDWVELAEVFENEFYCAYPRKEAPQEAFRAFIKLKTEWTPELKAEILQGLARYRASPQWRDPTKIPHPATWLNQRRWEGDPPDEGPPKGAVPPGPPPAKPTMYREYSED